MQFIKEKFMGIELDILTGHPDHDILFIATQVARAAGLKDPSGAVHSVKGLKDFGGTLRLGDVPWHEMPESFPIMPNGNRYTKTAMLFSEGQTYQMLLRGHAPASEPFRKWVTEEVLTSIRKTGQYNVNESTTETGQQFAGELSALHAALTGFRDEVLAKITNLEALIASSAAPAAGPSPYEGTTKSSLSDNLLFDDRVYREVGESLLSRPNLDKMKPYVLCSLEIALERAWAEEDGRPLETHVSAQKRKWTQWPTTWVRSKLDRVFYRRVLNEVINERMAKI